MNSKSVLLAALAASLLPVTAVAQASPAPSAAPAAPATQAAAPAASAPQAYPAKVALIAFQQAVMMTNEGQRAVADIRKKYEPKQTQLEALNTEIDTLKKQLQAAPATLSDADRAARMKTLDTKQKQLDRDTEDARTAYQADLQDAYGKVATKVSSAVMNYVEKNGYTLLLDVGGEQSSVMWAKKDPSSDITEAVVNAYNVSSGISAPPPDAPAGPAAAHPRTAPATPHTTAPKPAGTTPAKPQ
ncbi:MAG TPA: OmpH family outer membrane protein [Acidobacteriaceae bacterium]|jgi:outer membrane protein